MQYKKNNASAAINKGMNCLLEKLGPLDTEIFILRLIKDPCIYTKWRRDSLFTGLSLYGFNQKTFRFETDASSETLPRHESGEKTLLKSPRRRRIRFWRRSHHFPH